MENLVSTLRKHDLTVYRTGRIDISAHLASLLSLSPGDSINVAKDGNEFYIYVAHRASSSNRQFRSRVFRSSSGGASFRLQFKLLARRLMSECGFNGSVMRIPAGSPLAKPFSPVAVPLITYKIQNHD